MPANKRLQAFQSILEKRGVLDVKLTLQPGAAENMPLSTLKHSVADFLDAYLRGRFVIVQCIGDAHIAA